jgi:hypothetical protein
MRLRRPDSRASAGWAAGAILTALAAHACADPERDRLRATTKPTYDSATGKLTELTFDANKNGRVDTWTEMDGGRPLRSRVDTNEDGKADRWEYYDDKGKVVKVGYSLQGGDKPDRWAYAAANGRIERIESSSTADESRIDRWELRDTTGPADANAESGLGTLIRVEEDMNRDGRRDKWEAYENGRLKTAEFDENGDGRPDRRLTYQDGVLVLIESGPDNSGTYARKITPKG